MTQAELLAEVRRRLRDVAGDASEYLWSDYELIDIYANATRDRLFLKTRNMVIDSSTATDSSSVPLCSLTLVANTQSYALSPKIIKVIDVQSSTADQPMKRIYAEQLHYYFKTRNWRMLDAGTPLYWCTNLETDKISFFPKPSAADTIKLVVSRFPLARLDNDAVTAPTLDFREEYHDSLIPGIMSMAFTKKDAETDYPILSSNYRKHFDERCEEIKLEIQRRCI